MTLLSVIVPVYNSSKFLSQCLDSLINQTYKNLEIICVNDGSTDDSQSILEDYAKRDIRIKIVVKENGGLSSARNKGYECATGEFVTFVDSDDYLDADAYETSMKFANNSDLVCFGIKVFGDKKDTDDGYYKIKYSGLQTLTNRKTLRTDVSACNKIFKKSIIDKYKINFPEGFYYEDAEFFYKYIVNCKTAYYVKQYFYNYRRAGDSIMAQTFSGSPKAVDHLYIVKHIFDYYVLNNKLECNQELFLKMFENFFDFAYSNSDKDSKEKVLAIATEYALEFSKSIELRTNFMQALEKKEYEKLYEPDLKWYQKIYKVKKVRDKILDRNMVVKYVLGHKFVMSSKKISYPRISVIMPAYNAEKYIREAIDSILNQTFTNFELIIINDGSNDNTANIIKEYKDSRIKFVDNKENQGLISVLNYGLDIAQGEFIARMDADDISYPERFEKQVKFLEKNKNIGILGTWYRAFGNCEYKVDKKLSRPKLRNMRVSPVAHPTVMFRKELFDKYNLRYDMNYKHAEDYELWVRASKYTQVANLQEVLLDYRWSDTNVSTVHAKQQFQCAEVIKQRIRNKFSHKKSLLKIVIDDEQLLGELKQLGKFSYMPNSGNMGDMLIASSTMQWFDRNSLPWQRLKKGEQPKVLVYGGGGAWLKEWIKDLQPLMDMMKKCEKVVILPSSFNDVQEFVDILDERFVVFCRERKSFGYLTSQNTNAKILLDCDMALRLRKYIKIPFPPTKKLWKLSKKAWKQIKKLPSDVKMFRVDSESYGHYETDFDLSDALGWFSPYEPRKNIDFAVSEMLKILSRFNSVRTDRLHVGIASTLLAKEVYLYDNSYGKISGVYKQSLSDLPNVHYVEGNNIV